MFFVYAAVREKELNSGLINYAQGDVTTNSKHSENLNNTSHFTHLSINTTPELTMDQIKYEIMKRNTNKSKRIMVHAFLYVGAVFLTWTFATINRIIHTINGEMYPWILILGAMFTPLQGVFNCLIYLFDDK